MKRYIIFSFIAVSALLFASCEQESQPIYPNGDLPIFNGYMQFSTEVSTRSDLATNMRGRDFGVLGYSYSYTTNWGTAMSLATPDTFYNQQVLCGADGICRYDINSEEVGNQLKPWDATKWYTFFAYSPYNGAGITLSDSTATSIPYLTYEYAWLDNRALQGATIDLHNEPRMFDLVSAQAIDLDGSNNVTFNFKHRFFAIEVLANNYNETEYEYEYVTDEYGEFLLDDKGNKIFKLDDKGNKIFKLDENGNKIVIKNATQEISDLVLRITGLTNNKMTFPLQGSGDVEFSSTQDFSDKTLAFKISDYPIKIPAFNEPTADGRGEGVATSISKLSSDNGTGYVMLIPETAKLDFAVNWTQASNFSNLQNTFDSDMDFEAGKLYQIIINFVGSGITIALIEAGAWDYQSVTHTFE